MTPASVNEIAAINVTARFMVDRPAKATPEDAQHGLKSTTPKRLGYQGDATPHKGIQLAQAVRPITAVVNALAKAGIELGETGSVTPTS